MKVLKKMLALSVCAIAAVCFTGSAQAQIRERVVKSTSSQPTNLPPTASQPSRQVTAIPTSRPVLTNEVNVVRSNDPAYEPPMIQKTAATTVANSAAAMAAMGKSAYSVSTSSMLDRAIKSRYGLPYRYGSTGPNTYDCSGFVWSVFTEAGLGFTRESVRSIWAASEPVYGDDRYKFGTLIFLNGLGHMGIVADENGFYHASSSKGITYSPFKGYWEKRIVGFRRLKTAPAVAAMK